MISIVIPTRDMAAHLPALWQSIRSSGAASVVEEVVFVDDGSVDETPEVLRSIALASDRIRVLRNKNPAGRFLARKYGAEAAQCESVLFLDSRLELANGFGEALADVAHTHQAAMGVVEIPPRDIFCVYWDRSHRVIFREHHQAIQGAFDLTDENFDRMLKGTTVFLCNRDLFLGVCETFDVNSPPANDDTWLLKEIVHRTPIRVDPRLRIFWEPRRSWKAFLGRLFERGPSFVEYHVFVTRGVFFYAVLAGLAYLVLLVSAVFTSPAWALLLLGMGAMSIVLSVGAFSRSFSEAAQMMPLHAAVVLAFGVGILWGLMINSWKFLRPARHAR